MATIRRRGTKWQVQVRRQGMPPVSRSFGSKADASEWARHWESKADRGELPARLSVLRTITLGDLVKRYCDEIVPAKRGGDVESIVLKAFLAEPICRKKLAAITVSDFAAYRDDRLSKVTSITLVRQFAPLSHMFNVAQNEWGLPVANPVASLSIKGTNRRRGRRLSQQELQALVSSAVKTRNRLILPIILFALETGLRRGEILSIKWDHLDLDRRTLTIPQSKNGHQRQLPLSTPAMEVLAGRQRDGEYVFPVTAMALRLAWVRLVSRAEIHDLNFHDLRHEAISRLFEAGLTLPEVASMSGHRDPRMLMRYAHANHAVIAEKLHKHGLATKVLDDRPKS